MVYARDEYSATADLTSAEVGAHFSGLCWSWDNGPLPLDSSRRRRAMRVDESEWPDVWDVLAGRFWIETADGWIYPRLDEYRREREEFRRLQQERGRNGGRPAKSTKHNPDETRSKPERNPDENSPDSDLRTPISNSTLKAPKDQERDGAAAPLRLRPDDLLELWNELASGPIRRCAELTDKRRRFARARLRERPIDEWRVVIQRINASKFCRGETDRGDWVADFDWLLKPDTAVRVLEGSYDDRERPIQRRSTVPDAEETRRFLEEAFGQ
jgi:uncharacterized protein YdaU (DUF1376 family)